MRLDWKGINWYSSYYAVTHREMQWKGADGNWKIAKTTLQLIDFHILIESETVGLFQFQIKKYKFSFEFNYSWNKNAREHSWAPTFIYSKIILDFISSNIYIFLKGERISGNLIFETDF